MSDSISLATDITLPPAPLDHPGIVLPDVTQNRDVLAELRALNIFQSLQAFVPIQPHPVIGSAGPSNPLVPILAPTNPGSDSVVLGNPDGGDTFLLTQGNTQLALFGSNDKVILDGGTADIYDHAQGLKIDVASPLTGDVYLIDATPESAPLIDLLGGVGGFATAGQAYAALTSDGHDGSLLHLGAGALDIVGMAPVNLSAANFHIG